MTEAFGGPRPARYWIVTVFLTVMKSPENAGTRVPRKRDAMQLPVSVPANGGPEIVAEVTRPDGENVIVTVAKPLGSPSLRQELACDAEASSAALAAFASKAASAGAGSTFAVASPSSPG